MRRNLTREFSNRALYQDAGEAAAIQIYDGSLGGLIELFFGSGRWARNFLYDLYLPKFSCFFISSHYCLDLLPVSDTQIADDSTG